MVNEIVDIPLEMGNTPLDTVIKSLEYAPVKDILVKPLDPIKVTKEMVEQVPTGERDKDGFEKYETKTEVKEVISDFRKGVILAMPIEWEGDFKVGNLIVYSAKFAKDFDLFKDSQLVKPYDVVALVK